MDVSANQPAGPAAPGVQLGGPGIRRSPGRRRPSGQPPPLPHHLQTTGVGWLAAAVVLVALSLLVFGGGLHGLAVGLTVAEDAVVGWLAGLRAPGLLPAMRVMAALGSWMAITGLLWGLLLALLIGRRLRHLVVVLVSWMLQGFVIQYLLAPLLRRPRPFGVEFRADWYAWALPSAQMAALAAVLVGILYALVPEGRWRQRGKWVATALVALVALAHLDVGGARGQAIRQALSDQLGLVVDDVEPFGLAGSAGSTPLRIRVKGDPDTWLFGKLYAKSHLRADRWYKLGRELLYGRLEDEKPFNTVRRLVQQEDYALSLMQRAGLPRSTTRSSTTGWGSSAHCGTPALPTVTSSPPTCWCGTAGCC